MNLTEGFKEISNQILETRDRLTNGVDSIKEYYQDIKLNAFMEKVNWDGPKVLKDSPYKNNKEVILKVFENERQFRSDGPYFYEDETFQPRTEEVSARITAYSPNRQMAETVDYVPQHLWNDKDIALQAVASDGSHAEKLTPSLLNDKDIARSASKSIRAELQHFCPDIRDDREIVSLFVFKEPSNLKFASETLKNDKEIVSLAVSSGPECLEFASERLKNDKEMVLYAVQYDKQAIKHASPHLQAIAGEVQPAENLSRAIQAEKLSAKLSQQLKQKSPKQEKGIKI